MTKKQLNELLLRAVEHALFPPVVEPPMTEEEARRRVHRVVDKVA